MCAAGTRTQNRRGARLADQESVPLSLCKIRTLYRFSQFSFLESFRITILSLYNFIKYIRNSTVLISYVTLVIMAIRFKDYNLINNKLLEDMQPGNLELNRSMETFKLDNRNSYMGGKPRSPGDSLDELANLELEKKAPKDNVGGVSKGQIMHPVYVQRQLEKLENMAKVEQQNQDRTTRNIRHQKVCVFMYF